MPEMGGFTGTKALVQIDASDLIRVGNNMRAAGVLAGQAIDPMLDAMAQARLGALRQATPSQVRRDPRYPLKLVDSYVVTKGNKTRTISTLEARKFNFVTKGTSGPYPIYPRFKKALWWPGLDHPLPKVIHPGIRANNYVAQAEGKYEKVGGGVGFTGMTGTSIGGGDLAFASGFVDGIASAIVGLFLPVSLLIGLIAAPFSALMEWAQGDKKR